jgi:hypothetical protein
MAGAVHCRPGVVSDPFRSGWPLAAQDWIDIIQGVPGAGEAQQRDWSELYARIERLGNGALRRGRPSELLGIWQATTNPRQVYNLRAGTRTEVEDCIAAFT